jgi:hypothetical protein
MRVLLTCRKMAIAILGRPRSATVPFYCRLRAKLLRRKVSSGGSLKTGIDTSRLAVIGRHTDSIMGCAILVNDGPEAFYLLC